MAGNRLRLRGWRAILIGLFSGTVAAAALVGAVVLPTNGGDRHANADVLPVGCVTSAGASGARIEAPGAPPFPVNGDVINYSVGAANPPPMVGVACTVFNVDVFIRVPGEALYNTTPVCNIAELVSGETEFCPGTVAYSVDDADRDGELLIADVRAIGNKHDRPEECIEAPERDPNAVNSPPICYDSSATSVLEMLNTPTPTSTPTNTPTRTATNTPTKTSTPITPSNTPTKTRTPERERPTSTNTPAPTRTSAVLPATPRPSSTAIGVIALPPTGNPSGGNGNGALAYLIAGIAAAAALAAGAGLDLYRRRP